MIAVKQCLDIDIRPRVCVCVRWGGGGGRFKVWKMLTLVIGMCCVGFINPI
jgi:hypothetical protein